jgi:hypothetical protein
MAIQASTVGSRSRLSSMAACRYMDKKCQGPGGVNKSFPGHVSRSAAQVG